MKVLHYKSEVLYRKARDVTQEELGESLDKTMSQMATVMYSAGGVGLAGPQVGLDLRVIVADMSYVAGRAYGNELVKMVNPVLVSNSDSIVKAEEQCMSYPDLKVNVKRSKEITVKYMTPLGEEKEATYSDWQARVVLHEMDHLDGVTLYSRSGSLTKKRYDEMLKKKAK